MHDGEVDFDLVQPGRVHRQVDQAQVRPAALEPVDRGLATVGGAVVDHPVHPAGRGVGLDGHDLVDQPTERGDPGRWLAAAEQAGGMDVPGGQVGQRPTAVVLVLVLDAHAPAPARWQGRMAAAAGLGAGVLIGRDDGVGTLQAAAAEGALVQVQDPAGLGSEVRVAREDPRVVAPGLSASSASQRPSVGVETASMSPQPMTSARNSARLQRLIGTPRRWAARRRSP